MNWKKYLLTMVFVLGFFLINLSSIYAKECCVIYGSYSPADSYNECIDSLGGYIETNKSLCGLNEDFTTNIEDELEESGALDTFFKPTVGDYVGSGISFVMIIGAVICLVLIVAGGITWVTANGEKDNIEKARKRITSAIIGLVILASAWVLWLIVLNFLGFGKGGKEESKYWDISKHFGALSGSGGSSGGGTATSDPSDFCNGGQILEFEVGGPCCSNAKVVSCGTSPQVCTAGGSCAHMLDWSCCK